MNGIFYDTFEPANKANRVFNMKKFVANTFSISKGLSTVLVMLIGITASAQYSENVMVGPENEVVMKVVRQNKEIVISIFIADSLMFDYMTVERKADFDQSFSQCKYISYSDLKPGERNIIKKDNYPFPATSDVLYRLKMITKDGAMRTYAPIRLARLHDK